MTIVDQTERIRFARISQAKIALEEEIAHCGATVQERAYMRQKLEHLWHLVNPATAKGRP